MNSICRRLNALQGAQNAHYRALCGIKLVLVAAMRQEHVVRELLEAIKALDQLAAVGLPKKVHTYLFKLVLLLHDSVCP